MIIFVMDDLGRTLQRKGGWEPQSTVVRKGSGEFPTPLSHYCALGFPSSLSLQGPAEIVHDKYNRMAPLGRVNFFKTQRPIAFLVVLAKPY